MLRSSEHRDTEAFESVVEDEQLPQVVDELHDLFLSPGAPNAKMSVRIKGQLCQVLRNGINRQVKGRSSWVSLDFYFIF